MTIGFNTMDLVLLVDGFRFILVIKREISYLIIISPNHKLILFIRVNIFKLPIPLDILFMTHIIIHFILILLVSRRLNVLVLRSVLYLALLSILFMIFAKLDWSISRKDLFII